MYPALSINNLQIFYTNESTYIKIMSTKEPLPSHLKTIHVIITSNYITTSCCNSERKKY